MPNRERRGSGSRPGWLASLAAAMLVTAAVFVLLSAITPALLERQENSKVGRAVSHSPSPRLRGTVRRPVAADPSRPTPHVSITPVPTHAQCSIVIDDVGDNLRICEEFLSLGVPLTLAIIHDTRYATECARRTKAQGMEVLVHLPMEPLEAKFANADQIRVGMSDAQIRQRLDDALVRVPGAIGVNNHMGSRATADRQVMTALLTAIKDHGLFFLDSLTTPHSVARECGNEVGATVLRRDFFLDTDRKQAGTKENLLALGKYALKHSRAIGIGHAHRDTAAAIREMAPTLKAMGVELIRLPR